MNDRERANLPPLGGRGRLRIALILIGCVGWISAAGCNRQLGPQPYGKSSGASAHQSMNGLGALKRMAQQRGSRVGTWRFLSPRLERADVLVWSPDGFVSPSIEEIAWLEGWLASGDGRTLVYVGRDFDAEVGYWRDACDASTSATALPFRRKSALIRSQHTRRRSDMPIDQANRWFRMQRDQPRRVIRSLTSSHGWADGVDPAALEMELKGRLSPAPPGTTGVGGRAKPEQDKDAEDKEAEAPPNSDEQQPAEDQGDPAQSPSQAEAEAEAEAELQAREEEWERRTRYGGYQPTLLDEAPDAEVLLMSQGDPLVFRLTHADWGVDSQILVVANGSFLLNLQLVNHEHRKLAAKLVETAAPDPKSEIVFLESGEFIPIRTVEPRQRGLSGLELFMKWPLAPLSMHLLMTLLLAGFVLYPIFGRPREPREKPLSDFTRHVDELGRLLHETRDAPYARRCVDDYFKGQRAAHSSHTPNSDSTDL